MEGKIYQKNYKLHNSRQANIAVYKTSTEKSGWRGNTEHLATKPNSDVCNFTRPAILNELHKYYTYF